jgi:hypothetical protein
MLFREAIAVYCENHTEHKRTLCEQRASGGKYSNHWASALISETAASTRTSVKEDYYSFILSSTLKMKATISGETFVLNNYQTTERHIAEESTVIRFIAAGT